MLAKSQSSMSKVSVIVPCYNGEKIIGNAIKSVLNQTYKNWELIIVDDGSTDSSCEIVEHYLNNDKIKLVKNAYNKGIAKTMNKGIEVSTGDFIAFLDQDDSWHPMKLELQLQKFENADNSLGLVGCGMVFIENNKCRRIFRINDEKLDQTHILTKIFLTSTNSSSIMMLKKDCLKKIGLFDEKLIGWGDFEMVFRVAKFYKIGYVNRLLVKKRVHPESANVKMKKKLRNEAKKIFPLICGYHPFLKSYLPLKEGNTILGKAIESLHNKQYKQARQLSLKAIQYDPRLRIKSKLVYLLSCLGDIGLVIIHIRNKHKYIQHLATFRKERW
ncbi:MAG: Undecaprenyl-phosphate 4-deoxy-4-formamido-L-arabinose transferase [Candidatus Argoarchaeum ethanivorans]|uniref:Undecaprenyl-phosphate 4-deoxy-4-formamido-L-arabinose transferase n=1 Tax=Candidatus Argoarchaeum ethanivorans TaxID=2608793 RepID=A0A811T6J2_9EURY|nr:MAG: Undecaprenyl-phosphate 4-deoxy-4-formamido-L-arabinose transferase [Candidatus Argoarchaeum ethanivorans]